MRTLLRLTLGLVLVALALEGLLRISRPFSRDLNALLYLPETTAAYDEVDSLEALMRDTPLGFAPGKMWKGFVLNSRSLRTREYPVARQPGAYRIVTIGDSFTVGAGSVEHTWSVQLEHRLADQLQRPVEVFALGVPGVGPQFLLRLWELEHRLLDPDLVILGFFIGNDLTDDADTRVLRAPSMALVRGSYLVRLLRNLHRLRGASTARSMAGTDRGRTVPGADPELLTFSAEEHLGIAATRLQLCLRANRATVERLAAGVASVLERFREEVEAAGATFAVVLMPDEVQIDARLRDLVLQRLHVAPEAIDMALPQRVLAAHLEEAGIPYLDLLPAFRAAGAQASLYYAHNTHWNDEGNALAADEMAVWVERLVVRKPS